MKILYSPGWGAGWSTGAGGSDEFQKFMLTYPPLIEALERKEKITEDHPAVKQFLRDAEEKYNETPYVGGAKDLRIAEVSGPFRVEEYDGNESVIEPNDQTWITI